MYRFKTYGKNGKSSINIRYAFLFIVGIYILLRINLIDIPLERDEGTFGYFGQVINAGGVPYRDVVDNKPPVTFYLYALALKFVEPTARNIHLFMQAYNFLTLLVLFASARRLFQSDGASLWAAFIFAIYTSTWSVEGFAATTEMFMLLPLTLSLWTSLKASEKNQLGWMVLSGAFGALACWTKQVAAFSVLGVLILAISNAGLKNAVPKRSRSQSIAWVATAWLSGSFAISLIIVMPFWMGGALPEMVYWSFLHGLSYVQQSGNVLDNMVRVARWAYEGLPADTFPLVIGLAVPLLFIRQSSRNALFVSGFLVLSMIGTIPGHQYKHYFIQLAPAVALAAGWSLHNLMFLISSIRIRLLISLLIALLVFLATIASHTGYYLGATPHSIARVFFGNNPFPESIVVADYLKQHTSEDDTIFLFGSEPQILFLAERASASKFVPIYPLFQNFAHHAIFQAEAFQEITAAEPSYVVFTTIPTSFAWDGKASKWFEQQVLRLLKEEYRLVAWVPVSSENPKLRFVSGDAGPAFKEMIKYPAYLAIAKRIKK